MAKETQNFLDSMKARYHRLVGDINRFKAAFDNADQSVQEKYKNHYDNFSRHQTEVKQRFEKVNQPDADMSTQVQTDTDQYFQTLEKDLASLKAQISADDSIGWPEGQAAFDPQESIGWAEGQAKEDPVDSTGWPEGQSSTPPTKSEGWAEGYNKK